MLLDGPPGVGKTMFVESVAQLIGTGFVRFNFETAQTTSELTGSDEHWSNAKAGRLFSLMTEGKYANPVVLIDEVDKAGGASSYTVNSSLYSLLETGTAKAWVDLAFPRVKLDVSRVIWLLTSNDMARIPAALRSRMRTFEIPALTTEQSRDVAKQIFAGVADEFREIGFSTDLPVSVAAVIATASPREMQRLCREMIALAVSAERRAVQQSDLSKLGFAAFDLVAWSLITRQWEEADRRGGLPSVLTRH